MSSAAGGPGHKIRFVTATSLFDGHDVSINIMRRILQANGAEVIHLGHNRSVDEIVTAALQEDVQGIAVSSYQGGHVEFFRYMIDLLRERGGAHVKVFGGGGGVIVPDEIAELHAYGVARIFTPEDGQHMGLVGMIRSMIEACDDDLSVGAPIDLDLLRTGEVAARHRHLAQLITALENGKTSADEMISLHEAAAKAKVPTLGVTGTGGSGKSSLIDELVRRLRLDQADALDLAIISVDPSRRKTGGALLGDRIRMNAIGPWGRRSRVFMRSMATREAGTEISQAVPDVIAACKVAGFDLIVVETSGIGQGDAAIVRHSDVSLYVMTPEFGAASQLEKIDMLDLADFIAINKFDRRGAEDALQDVARQYERNHEPGSMPGAAEAPVFGTQAARFNDDGVTALYFGLLPKLSGFGLNVKPGKLEPVTVRASSETHVVVPAGRVRYLAEIVETVRGYRAFAAGQVRVARERQQLREAAKMLAEAYPHSLLDGQPEIGRLETLALERDERLDGRAKELLATWPDVRAAYRGRRVLRQDPRRGGPHEAGQRVAVRHQDPQGRPAALRGRRRDPSLADAGERARLVPLRGRRVRLQTRERRADPDVRR